MSKAALQSIKDRIKNIGNKTKTPIQYILIDFFIERAVFRLIQDETLKQHLVFKGGSVSLRCYESPRFTVDLDAISHKKSPQEIIDKAKTAMELETPDFVWFEYEKQVDLSTQNEEPASNIEQVSGRNQAT